MAKNKYKTVDGILKRIKNDLEQIEENRTTSIITLYAHNGSGKTQLSKLFQDKYEEKVLCYNAFVEDFFHWDNENTIFNIDKNSWILKLIEAQGLNSKIADNFKDFIGLNIEPDIDTKTGNVKFNIPTGDKKAQTNIKISKGEESTFIWTVFYTILEVAIDELKECEENRSTQVFNNKKYIIIDDPVSSLDDTKIITIALKIIKLIKDSGNIFHFLITTHHALFFNILYCHKNSGWKKINYILSKSDNVYYLKKQRVESPFAYHQVVIEEIQNAIKNNKLKKYHFNLFRCLLEKTANFLGYEHWKKCLDNIKTNEDFLKIIDHYSHDKLSELEYSDLLEANIEVFKNTFENFIKKYNWSCTNNE